MGMKTGIHTHYIFQRCCYLMTKRASCALFLLTEGRISLLGVPFPKNFMSVAKTILKRLFRVYAHIYHQHFDPVIQLQEEAHLNTSFKHFIFFVQVGGFIRLFLLHVYLQNSVMNKWCIYTVRTSYLIYILFYTFHDDNGPFSS